MLSSPSPELVGISLTSVEQPTHISYIFLSHATMDFDSLQSAVADTLVWDPKSVKLETYASIDHPFPTVVDLMEWMVPASKIPAAFRYNALLVVSRW